jgi:hypothetical protein
MLERRTLMQAMLATGTFAGEAFAAENPPSPRTREDDLMLWAKLTADLSGRTSYSLTVGTVWGFKPQADDLTLADFAKRLYGYHSLVARKARVESGKVIIKTKSWTFYQEPKGYTFVRELLNPYTGQVDQCPPMSGPAAELVFTTEGNERATPPYPVELSKPERPFDLRVKVVGDQAFINETTFSRLKPGGISWWKLEGQMISHTARAADVSNPKLTRIPNTWSHNLVAEWQTWMRMHGTPGHILFKGDGCFIAPDQVPADLMAALEEAFPGQWAEVRRWDT